MIAQGASPGKGVRDRRVPERGGRTGHECARVVHLTAAEKRLNASAFAEHESAMERAAPGLTEAGRARFVALLKKLGLDAQRLLR